MTINVSRVFFTSSLIFIKKLKSLSKKKVTVLRKQNVINYFCRVITPVKCREHYLKLKNIIILTSMSVASSI